MHYGTPGIEAVIMETAELRNASAEMHTGPGVMHGPRALLLSLLRWLAGE